MSLKKKCHILQILILISCIAIGVLGGYSFVMIFETVDLKRIINIAITIAVILWIACFTFWGELIESIVNKLDEKNKNN